MLWRLWHVPQQVYEYYIFYLITFLLQLVFQRKYLTFIGNSNKL